MSTVCNSFFGQNFQPSKENSIFTQHRSSKKNRGSLDIFQDFCHSSKCRIHFLSVKKNQEGFTYGNMSRQSMKLRNVGDSTELVKNTY